MGARSRYILHKKIARGGMAEIYLGKQIGEDGFQRICCIKRIRPDFAQEEDFVKMFRDEAHICKRLQHANIVRVEGFEEVEGSYAIIMELVSGGDLRSLLAACEKSGIRIPVPMALYMTAEAARGLHYAHTKKDDISGGPLGIVHRDISPQNILLSFEGEVKVTDFGIAEADNRNTETTPGVIKGKYAYMSPEQISGQSTDARTDVFALSIVLWEVLAMKKLFWAENEVLTIQKVRNCMIDQDLREINKEVSPQLHQLVMKGLARDANMRYENAAEFESTIRKFLSANYVNFTVSVLEQFMKQVLNDRLKEMETQIKTALSDISLPKESTVTTLQSQGTDDQSKKLNLGVSTDSSLNLALTNSGVQFEEKEVGTQQTSESKVGLSSGTHRVVPEQTMGVPQYAPAMTKPVTRHAVPVFKERRAKPRKPEKKQLDILTAAIGILILLFVAGMGSWLFKKVISSNDISRMSLFVRPEMVKINYQGEPLYKSRYISGPIKISYSSSRKQVVLDPANRNKVILPFDNQNSSEFEFYRKGFETEYFNPVASLTEEHYLVLNPTSQMAPTQISVAKEQGAVWIILDDMLVRTKLSSPIEVKNLVFGAQHTLKIYPNGFQSAEGGFVCTFKPRSTSWSAPYIVLINPSVKKCSFPSRL